MKPQAYNVIFEGDVLPGFGQLDVMKKIATLMSLEETEAARLFMGKQFVIKRQITLEQAKKVARSLARLGGICFLVADQVYQKAEAESEPAMQQDRSQIPAGTGTLRNDAFADYFENRFKAIEAQAPYELIDPDDATQPRGNIPITDVRKHESAQRIARELQESLERQRVVQQSPDSEGRDDPTLPGGYPVYTDVSKINKMQELTQRMLAQKKLYER